VFWFSAAGRSVQRGATVAELQHVAQPAVCHTTGFRGRGLVKGGAPYRRAALPEGDRPGRPRKGADYVFGLKDNQDTLHAAAKTPSDVTEWEHYTEFAD
jgi:hypothetical protein